VTATEFDRAERPLAEACLVDRQGEVSLVTEACQVPGCAEAGADVEPFVVHGRIV
jgi:hypothetical protein